MTVEKYVVNSIINKATKPSTRMDFPICVALPSAMIRGTSL